MALGLAGDQRPERRVITGQEGLIPAKPRCQPAAVTAPALALALVSHRQRLVCMALAQMPERLPAHPYKTVVALVPVPARRHNQEGLARFHRIPAQRRSRADLDQDRDNRQPQLIEAGILEIVSFAS